MVPAGRYSVTAESGLFGLYSSDINEVELSCGTLMFLSPFIPLNKARLYQVAFLCFRHPCEMECVCKEHCDKDKLLSLSLLHLSSGGLISSANMSYGSWGTAASPKQNLKISWKINGFLSVATLGSTVEIANDLKHRKETQLLLANINYFIHEKVWKVKTLICMVFKLH